MAPSVSLSLVKFDVVDGVATVTINRPESLNSLNPVVVHQMQQAVDQALADPAVRGLVIGGEGKAFVVGADVEFFVRNIEAGDFERIVQFTRSGQQLLNTLDRSPKPVVARVGGAALGGGFELALACDCIVASPSASFAFPETGLGIYPGLGGTQRTSRAIGIGLAKWLILTGKTLSAADAAKIGLVDQVVAAEQLDEACHRLALGPMPRQKSAAVPAELTAIAQFFETNRAADLIAGRVETGDDSALIRSMRSVASKPVGPVQMAEWLIEEGSRRTLDEGLQMELDHLAEIFGAEEASRRLAACAKR